MAHDVFISYSSHDKTTADAACAVLEQRGIRCWIAPRDILPGESWGGSIVAAINDAKAMVLVFSSHANRSPQVEREVERAINRGIPLLPMRIENVVPNNALEYFISMPHWLDAFTPPLEGHLNRLADSLQLLMGQTISEQPGWRPSASIAGVEKTVGRRNDNKTVVMAVAALLGVTIFATLYLMDVIPAGQSIIQTNIKHPAPVQPCDSLAAVPRREMGALPTFADGTDLGIVQAAAAIVVCTQALQEFPNEPRFRAWLGRAYLAAGRSSEALDAFRAAASQGDAVAQTNLGVMLEGGEGVPKDEAAAVSWYLKAAQQGFPRAQKNLGLMFENGNGVAKDAVAASDWYRKSAEQGFVEGQYSLGLLLAKGADKLPRDPPQAVKWYRLAADQGYADAQLNLGILLATGDGVPTDESAAVILFRRAADQGSPGAQFLLGVMLKQGRGTAKDEPAAVGWLRRSAEQGNANAQVNLGWMIANGLGAPKNAVLAARWYRKAADQSVAGAQYLLGLSYADGSGVPKDLAQARLWMERAAAIGQEPAKQWLAAH